MTFRLSPPKSSAQSSAPFQSERCPSRSAAPWCCPQPCAQLLHSSVACCYLIKPFLLPHFDSVPCRVGPLIPGLLCFASQSSVPPHLSVMQAQGGDFTVMSNMMLWLPIFPYIVLFFPTWQKDIKPHWSQLAAALHFF